MKFAHPRIMEFLNHIIKLMQHINKYEEDIIYGESNVFIPYMYTTRRFWCSMHVIGYINWKYLLGIQWLTTMSETKKIMIL